MFVGFILDNIWAVYETAQSNDPESLEKREKVVKRLALTVQTTIKHEVFHTFLLVSPPLTATMLLTFFL